MQQHFGPALFAPVEPGVGVRGLVEGQFVGDDQRGAGLAADDQVASSMPTAAAHSGVIVCQV